VVGDILQPTHLLLILVVALVVLGPKRLPEVGRSLGKGLRDFRGAISGMEEHTSGFMTDSTEDAEPAPHESAPIDAEPIDAEPIESTHDAEPIESTHEGEPTSSDTATTEAPTVVEPPLAAAATASTQDPAENAG
jgi:TatA/E family protein of Tat protein translocase